MRRMDLQYVFVCPGLLIWEILICLRNPKKSSQNYVLRPPGTKLTSFVEVSSNPSN